MRELTIRSTLDRLEAYCREEDYKGWDPYDGLNSTVFQRFPFSQTRLAKIAWIQFFKRSPLNLRPYLGVPKQHNAQALGLFISGYCNLYKVEPDDRYLDNIRELVKEVCQLESQGWSGSAWGYNFEWQARAFNQPRNSPTVVATSFVVYGLLDAFELLKEPELLEKARSACEFILKDLYRTPGSAGHFAFSYSPLDRTVIYNASLLASKSLARVYSHSGEEHLIQAARNSVGFCCLGQRSDGSWPYGTKHYHQWTDSFHTGYNLESLAEYGRFSGDDNYQSNLDSGLDYYLNNFFLPSGVPKYYNDRINPIDINCPAQLVTTLSRVGMLRKQKDLVSSVLDWTFQNMLDSQGYFYYQVKPGLSSKIPYMRWAQAWMFCSLSFYLLETLNDEGAG